MTYRRNFFSYFNFLGISFCIFIAWASYFGYKELSNKWAFGILCILCIKSVMFAKFKNDILETISPSYLNFLIMCSESCSLSWTSLFFI